ncbi:MAG: GNAT family protein [Fulvimonas sp.]|nr:GNAT family protein [Fulvimonas sp.]
MELHTSRLRIDALHDGDVAALFAYRGDAEVVRYQGWRPQSLAEAAAFIERQRGVVPGVCGHWQQFALRLRGDDTLIGDLGLHVVDDATVEFGITLAPAWQGRGLAGEAMRAMLALAFERMGKHRAIASVDPRNHACVRMLERIGMRKEAHFRESLRWGDGWADDAIYAMLAREWASHRAATHDRG